MEIKRINIDDFSIVCNFLAENFSSPTHWPDWNLIVSEHYKTNFYYFGAYDGGKLLGIYPVHEVGIKKGILLKQFSGHFMLIPNGGWIFTQKRRTSLNEIPKHWNTLISLYSLPILPEFNVNYTSVKTKTNTTLIVKLDRDLDEIWSESVKSKRRNMIRKAQARNIKIKQAQTQQDVIDFYKLYKISTDRLKMNSLPISLFFDLFSNPKNIKIDLLMAFADGTQVANMAMIYDKNYSIYWLGNTISETPNNGQGDLLQWEAIKRAKEAGCKYYDLCFIDEVKLPHIYRFKSGFSNQKEDVISYKRSSFLFKALNRMIYA
jgi:hypothetical protein